MVYLSEDGISRLVYSPKIEVLGPPRTMEEFLAGARILAYSPIDAEISGVIKRAEKGDIISNSIIVGGPVANPLARRYMDLFDERVTNFHPGKSRGVIQIARINGYLVILVAGSDRYGTKAAIDVLLSLEDLPQKPVFVELGEDGRGEDDRLDPGDNEIDLNEHFRSL